MSIARKAPFVLDPLPCVLKDTLLQHFFRVLMTLQQSMQRPVVVIENIPSMSAASLLETEMHSVGDERALQDGKRQSLMSSLDEGKKIIEKQRQWLAWYKEKRLGEKRLEQEHEEQLAAKKKRKVGADRPL